MPTPFMKDLLPGARRVSYFGVENGSNKTGYRPSYKEIITTKSWPRLFPIRDAKSTEIRPTNSFDETYSVISISEDNIVITTLNWKLTN